MADNVNFNLDGLEKFLEGIEKLKTIGEQFASSMETAPKGRSKAAQEMRAEQLKLLQSFTQIFRRTAKTYKLHDRQQESLLKADIAARKRHSRVQDAALKREEAELKLRAKREEQIFRKEKLRQDTTERLRAQRRKLKFDIGSREQRFAQTASQYEAMSEMHYQRRAGASAQRLSEQEARLARAKQYETEIAEEAMARRKRERAEKRSEKNWDNLQKFAIATTKTIFLAPFKMVGVALAALWKMTKNVLGSSARMMGKGVALAGNLISNVSDMTFGARASGTPAFGAEYLGASFKGVFDAPALLQRMTALRANPLDIAYPMMYGAGSRVGASPNEAPASAMAKLAEYAYGESKKYGANIGLRRAIDPLLQQFSTEELLAMQRTPEEAFKKRTAAARSNFGIDEATLQTISDFDMSLNTMSIKIKAYFSTKLAPALGPLEELGKSFVKLFDNILTDDKINEAVKFTASKIDELGEWLGKKETKEQFDKMMTGLSSTIELGWKKLEEIKWDEVKESINTFADIVKSSYVKLAAIAGVQVLSDEDEYRRKMIRDEEFERMTHVKRNEASKFLGSIHEKWGELTSKYATADIPQSLLEAVMDVESKGNPNAVSPKNAKGLMQTIQGTFNRFSGGSADPFDPESNIKAGAGYLNYLYKFFKGDINKTIMAYNAGEGNISKGIIPGETKGYLEKVLANYTAGDVSKINNALAPKAMFGNSSLLNDPSYATGYNMPKPVSVSLSIQDRQSSSSLGVQLDKVAGAIGGSFAFSNQFSGL